MLKPTMLSPSYTPALVQQPGFRPPQLPANQPYAQPYAQYRPVPAWVSQSPQDGQTYYQVPNIVETTGLSSRSGVEEHFIHRKSNYQQIRTANTNQMVFVADDGDLYTRAKLAKDYQYIGRVFANGWFKLVNGLQGSIFNNEYLKIWPSGLNGRLGEALKAEERRLTVVGSEIPHIRQHLTSRGIDGRGVTIYALEFQQRDHWGQAQPADHVKLIASTLTDPEYGVVPGANVQMLMYQSPKSMEVSNDDTPQTLITKMVKGTVAGTDALTARVNWLADNASGPSVVSFSVGTSPYEDARYIYSQIEARDEETGHYKNPDLRQRLLGPNHDQLTTAAKVQHLTNWVTNVWESNPDIQQAFARYGQAVDKATAKGIPINVAMGNDNTSLPLDVRVPVKALFNWYCLPGNVIRVSASDNNATPNDVSDDTVAAFSTRGSEALPPTLAMTGVRVFIDRYFAGNHTGGWSGTSVATPLSAATQAMMLQLNPDLTVPELVALMGRAAHQNQTTMAETGLGIVDMVNAVYNAAPIQ